MVAKKVTIRTAHGIHARVAARVAEECLRFESDISICKGCEKANGCSILELMSIGASDGCEVEIKASGYRNSQFGLLLTINATARGERISFNWTN